MTSLDTAQRDELVQVANLQELEEFLREHGVDTDAWTGLGKVKKSDDFYKEIKAGEAQLVRALRGEAHIAIRQIRPAGAYVFHFPRDEETGLYLREEYVQDKIKGEKTDRKRPYSIGEKAIGDETHQQAIVRGVREELGVDGEVATKLASKDVREEKSASFPGMTTQYQEERFNVLLADSQYRPEGYTENGAKKIIHFIWEATKQTRSAILAVGA